MSDQATPGTDTPDPWCSCCVCSGRKCICDHPGHNHRSPWCACGRSNPGGCEVRGCYFPSKRQRA